MSEFAHRADTYAREVEDSISFGGAEHEFFIRRKADTLVDLASRFVGPPATLSVLDVGCGVGLTDEHLVGRFGAVHGVDVDVEPVAGAQERNPGARYTVYAGDVLPFAPASFDVVFAICVMHHVPPPRHRQFVQELARVVRPEGIVAVFEHNPFNPLTRLAVSRCEFDADAVLLTRRRVHRLLEGARLVPVEQRYLIFTTIDRPAAVGAERWLRGVPLGAQHYVAARPQG